MFVDNLALLWNAAALTADAASTNTYDTLAAGTDVTAGEPLTLCLQVDVAADHTTGDETYEFQVIQSANADLSSPDILVQRTILYSALTAGTCHYLPIPPGSKTKRYLGAYYNGGGTTPTITVTAHFAPSSMIQLEKVYAKGYTIS